MKKQVAFFSAIYFPLTFFVGVVWVEIANLRSIVFFAFWQLVMGKIVYDIVLLATTLTRHIYVPQKLNRLSSFPKVALLYTCRDDVVEKCLIDLINQDYPNYDIFILDDSQSIDTRKTIEDAIEKLGVSKNKIKVFQRETLDGFKAGNLNNWLKETGNTYKYFVIFDNDSLAEKDFITQLVKYAEHPDNTRTAIFQSAIIPWNKENYFVKWIGALAPLYSMQEKKNNNRTGTAISFGHNNLHRTSSILEIGGFNETLTSEDTAITFELDIKNYKTEMVDALSYETEPATITQYKRRSVRWAAQTMALFRQSWREASSPLKFELGRQIVYYAINIVFLFWVLGSMWYFEDRFSLQEQYQQIISLSTDYSKVYFLSFLIVFSTVAIYFLLHFIVSLKSDIRILDYLGHLVISSAIFFYTATSIIFAILKVAVGKQVYFEPSNTISRSVSILAIIDDMKFLWIASFAAIFLYFYNQQSPWNYWGGLWALFIFFTPLILFYAQKYPVAGNQHYD